MLVKDVLLKYHKIVPFPWSVSKIKKAGLYPTPFLLVFAKELQSCEDINTETGRQLIQILQEVEMFP